MENNFSIAFVLYNDKNIVVTEIERNYEKLWHEKLEVQAGLDQLKGHIAQFEFVISFVDEPIDEKEMVQVAKHNPFFEEGIKIAQKHQCHALVGVRGVGNAVARYKVLTKLLAATVSSYNAVAVYLGEQQLFYSKEILLEGAKSLDKGQLPVHLWLYFGFYAHNEAFWVYTQGMKVFNREELEISADDLPMQILHEILMYLATVLISTHRQFEDEELIEVGECYLTVTHRESPALQTPTLFFRFEKN